MSDGSRDLDARRERLSAEQRAALAQRLRGSSGGARRTIPRRPVRRDGPLSFAQRRMWFLDRLDGGAAYHRAVAVRLLGDLDADVLAWALHQVACRHEVLRTCYPLVDGRPVQRVSDAPLPPLDVVDGGGATADRGGDPDRLLRGLFDERFDLESGPLVRWRLVRESPRRHVLGFVTHHLGFDGWSEGRFLAELVELYDSRTAGRAPQLPELAVQYADFAAWQVAEAESERCSQHLEHWVERLADSPPPLGLPFDGPRPTTPSSPADVVEAGFDEALTAALADLGRRRGVTLFTVLLTAFAVALHRLSGETDIAIGTPVAGRPRAELQDLIGLFLNTLVMRLEVDPEAGFLDLLAPVHRVVVAALDHQDVPFERVVEGLRPRRDVGRSPLFDVLFNFENVPRQEVRSEHLAIEPFPLRSGRATHDLAVEVDREGGGLRWSVTANAALFGRSTVERMMRVVRRVVEGSMAAPEAPVGRLPVLDDPERRRILVDWNATARRFDADRTVADRVAEQAARTPGSPALLHEGRTTTYGELGRSVDAAAAVLRRCGCRPGESVGIRVARSPAWVAVVLGAMRCGAVVVLLDPDDPPVRVAEMAADVGARRVVADERNGPGLVRAGVEVIPAGDVLVAGNVTPQMPPVSGADPAYVAFTSGSTGRPKGVRIRHRSLVNHLLSVVEDARLDHSLVAVANAPLSFDACLREVFVPLLVGGRVVLLPHGADRDPRVIAETMAAHGVTHLLATVPSMLGGVLAATRGGPRPGTRLREVMVSGEPLHGSLVAALRDRFGPALAVWNYYGPTETTLTSTVYRVPPEFPPERPVPVGRPIVNTTAYVLDRHLEPVPVGVVGEVFLGGLGVGDGYVGRDEQTAERFVADPFASDLAAKLYRSGDLGRWREDGELELLGRTDRQVKVRGNRVEPAEVEAALLRLPGVRHAAVRPTAGRSDGDVRLVAYVVSEWQVDGAELRERLRERLPEFMVPSDFVSVDELPRTRSGKVAYDALPPLGCAEGGADARGGGPRDELESALCRIWERVLQAPRVGVEDEFFDLGGHSLLAVELFVAIERELGVWLPLATVFEAPTVAAMAAKLRRGSSPGAGGASCVVSIRPAGGRPPLFCIHGAGGNVVDYQFLADELDPDQPVLGIQSLGLVEPDRMHMTVAAMASHYAGEIRRVCPAGPVLLAGSSFGGKVAFEVARQMAARGDSVALVAMLDSAVSHLEDYPAELRARLRVRRLAGRLANVVRNVASRSPTAAADYLRRSVRTVWRRVRNVAWRAEARRHAVRGQAVPSRLRHVVRANAAAARAYRMGRYPGEVVLFRAERQGAGTYDPERHGWQHWAAGGVEVVAVPGDHVTMVQPPHVAVLGRRLQEAIDRAIGAGQTDGDLREGKGKE